MSTSGKSSDFDSAIRRFESYHPNHLSGEVNMKRLVLVSGSSNLELSKRIAKYLDITLVNPGLVKFANGEVCCEVEKSVRGADVFIIQSTSTPANDNLMELLIVIDALKRASAASITAVMPNYGYSRQDRKISPRSPITAKLVANLISAAGATRVITMDLHAGQIQGFFDIPFDNIYGSPVMVDYIRKNISTDNAICVSPDSGGVERVSHYAKKLGLDIAMIDKRRTGRNVAKAMNIVGNIKGKDCILIDDMIDTAGTLVEACRALKENGATKVFAIATHGVFSNPAIERIAGCEALDRVVVTDTIPLSEEGKKVGRIHVVSITEVLAKAIHRTFNNDSVSSLFL